MFDSEDRSKIGVSLNPMVLDKQFIVGQCFTGSAEELTGNFAYPALDPLEPCT